MSYMSKQDLEIIATFFNLVPTEDVIRAVGDWKVTGRAGKWCFGPAGEDEPPRPHPDPTVVAFTTDARGEGMFSLDGQCQYSGTAQFSLRDDFRGALEDLSLGFCRANNASGYRREYRDYCRQNCMRVGSKYSSLMFMYEYALSWQNGTVAHW